MMLGCILISVLLINGCSLFEIDRKSTGDVISGQSITDYCGTQATCQCGNDETLYEEASGTSCVKEISDCLLLYVEDNPSNKINRIYTILTTNSQYTIKIVTGTSSPVCDANKNVSITPIFVRDYQTKMIWNPSWSQYFKIEANVVGNKVQLTMDTYFTGFLVKMYIQCGKDITPQPECIAIKYEGKRDYPLTDDVMKSVLGVTSTSTTTPSTTLLLQPSTSIQSTTTAEPSTSVILSSSTPQPSSSSTTPLPSSSFSSSEAPSKSTASSTSSSLEATTITSLQSSNEFPVGQTTFLPTETLSVASSTPSTLSTKTTPATVTPTTTVTSDGQTTSIVPTESSKSLISPNATTTATTTKVTPTKAAIKTDDDDDDDNKKIYFAIGAIIFLILLILLVLFLFCRRKRRKLEIKEAELKSQRRTEHASIKNLQQVSHGSISSKASVLNMIPATNEEDEAQISGNPVYEASDDETIAGDESPKIKVERIHSNPPSTSDPTYDNPGYAAENKYYGTEDYPKSFGNGEDGDDFSLHKEPYDPHGDDSQFHYSDVIKRRRSLDPIEED